MDESTQNLLRAAEEAVSRRVEHCAKNGTLYPGNRKATAQVSRTGKWHLNAITALRREINMPQAKK